jgi:hypothetical protein
LPKEGGSSIEGIAYVATAAGLVVVVKLLWETTGLRFASAGLGVCLEGGAVVTAVGAGLVVVAPPGCPTKSRTKRLEIQPCCFALVVVFDFLECRSLLEEAGRWGVLLLQGACVCALAAAGISESFFKGCGCGSVFVFGHVGCRIVVVSFCIVVLSL